MVTNGEALGAIFEQEERPVGYTSGILNQAEKNYLTTERELLALPWATRNYHCELFRRPFKIILDRKLLKGMLKVRDIDSRMARLEQKISEYDYELLGRPGRMIENTNTLSRAIQKQELAGLDSSCLLVTRPKARMEANGK